MSEAVDPSLRSFRIPLIDGSEVELRYPWPALAQAEDWLGLPWLRWDLTRHAHLQAVIAAGRLHDDRSILHPTEIAWQLDPTKLAMYRQVVDDAVTFAHTGKTRLERVQETESERKAEEAKAKGKRKAARKG